jgi:hypothetical protein
MSMTTKVLIHPDATFDLDASDVTSLCLHPNPTNTIQTNNSHEYNTAHRRLTALDLAPELPRFSICSPTNSGIENPPNHTNAIENAVSSPAAMTCVADATSGLTTHDAITRIVHTTLISAKHQKQ